MTDWTTEAGLVELLRLGAAATDGPLMVNRYDEIGGDISYQIQQSRGGGEVVAGTNDHRASPRAKVDAELFVASREAVPQLVARIRELEQLLKEQLEQCEDFEAHQAHAAEVRSRSLSVKCPRAHCAAPVGKPCLSSVGGPLVGGAHYGRRDLAAKERDLDRVEDKLRELARNQPIGALKGTDDE